MPIIPSDLKFYLSGGAANTNPNNSLGGAISSTQVVSNKLHNLFDVVNNLDSVNGATEYRCIYVKNTSFDFILQNTKLTILSNTSSPDTSIEVSWGTSAINGTEQTVANETTAPTGMSWTTGTTASIGTLQAQGHKAIWIKRIVNTNSDSYNNDTTIIKVFGNP